MIYNYDYRRASDTATPTFDKLFKERSKIEGTLNAGSKKLTALADKVEKLVSKGAEDSKVIEALGEMQDASYLVFNPFRELLSKGEKELEGEKGEADIFKQAKNLLAAVKHDLNKAHNGVAQVIQDKNTSGAKKASHELAMAVSTLKTIFRQYADAYGH